MNSLQYQDESSTFYGKKADFSPKGLFQGRQIIVACSDLKETEYSLLAVRRGKKPAYHVSISPITGKPEEWSLHSYGLAIDINPECRGVLTDQDRCYKAFCSRGWK